MGIQIRACLRMSKPPVKPNGGGGKTFKSRLATSQSMEHTLAMQIFGVVMILVGVMKNWDPVGFNKNVFGDVEGVEGGAAASMRMLIGGAFAGLGGLNVYCSFMIDELASEGDFILIGNVIALVVILSTLLGAKFRGFLEEIPVPPLVLFPTLIAMCLYAATY